MEKRKEIGRTVEFAPVLKQERSHRNLQHVASDRADRSGGKAGTVYFRIQQGWQPDCCRVRSASVRSIRKKGSSGSFTGWPEKERQKFSTYKPGDQVEILGPLGNGFPLEEAEGKKHLLIGGGIGIPPMLELAKQLNGEKQMQLLGYRDENCFSRKNLSEMQKLLCGDRGWKRRHKGKCPGCYPRE